MTRVILCAQLMFLIMNFQEYLGTCIRGTTETLERAMGRESEREREREKAGTKS